MKRVRAQGTMWMSARGGAFTPVLCALIFRPSWRGLRDLRLPGLVWAFYFFRWFRDDPKDHPDVNAAELELPASRSPAGSHGDVPWRKLVANRSVLLLWLQYFLITYPWYFYITWLSTYLREYFKVTNEMTSAWYAVLPLLFGGIGCLFSGMILPRVATWVGGTIKARRIVATCGFIGAGGFMLLCIQQNNPLYGMLAMGMASFCNDLVMPCAWGACMDIGGRRRHPLRLHEHDGQPRRVRRAAGRRYHPRRHQGRRLSQRRLQHVPLHDGRRLFPRGFLLAVH